MWAAASRDRVKYDGVLDVNSEKRTEESGFLLAFGALWEYKHGRNEAMTVWKRLRSGTATDSVVLCYHLLR